MQRKSGNLVGAQRILALVAAQERASERPGPSASLDVCISSTSRRRTRAEMARRILLALACIGAAEAGSALAEGTTPLTAANFDDFVEGALAAGKTAMVRFIASEG